MVATLNVDEILGTMDAVLKQATGKGIDAMIEEHMEADASLEHMAAQITEKIGFNPEDHALTPSFMLTEPLQLTVKKANKPGDGYSKRPHIGGESFRPVRCYAGKRNSMIYVFKPVEAADYVEMEMSESMARKSLGGFAAYLDETIGRDLRLLREKAQQNASIEAERKRLSEREKDYDGFGSW